MVMRGGEVGGDSEGRRGGDEGGGGERRRLVKRHNRTGASAPSPRVLSSP